MKNSSWKSRLALLGLAVVLFGCDRRSGEAVVRDKEHIPVAEIVPSPSVTPPGDAPSANTVIVTEISGPDMRGTSSDPRAGDHEQWIVHVEMVQDRRRIEVQVEEPRWNTLKIGDRVQLTYKVGKYTGTIWDSRIE